ncbi:hypothetical protein [Halorussus halophilus]|uniref:hypothetical protein n=1 Tax=Halorussus halophilus TaxID=2650975 RepID=UPI0013013B25|nr:hypothetical protein [Halorussus halophilus]
MTAEFVSRWARRHVAVGALFLVAWQIAAVLETPHRASVTLGLYGFVLHTVVGKGYALVPTYFERSLTVRRAPVATLPLLTLGSLGMAAASVPAVPTTLAAIGAVCWGVGMGIFVGALGVTIRGNLLGSETGTGDVNADRQRIDRLANAFVPIVFVYLLAGTYETVAVGVGLPLLADRGMAGASHLLAAGGGALLIFAIGFRLLPRFLVASPPTSLVSLVLSAGAVGPALLAGNLWGTVWFRIGAVAESTAIVGFAVAYLVLFRRSDRRRVGFYGPVVGSLAGVAGVALGLHFAFGGPIVNGAFAHFRLNVLGFLGLTIVGVAYQFYPPGVGTFPAAGDRTAGISIGCLAVGVGVEAGGLLAGLDSVVLVGRLLALVGAGLYAYLLWGLFRERYGEK